MNSARVWMFSRNAPSRVLVTMDTPCLWTPRVVMQWCTASITTATPSGFSALLMHSAIWAVIFSCT